MRSATSAIALTKALRLSFRLNLQSAVSPMMDRVRLRKKVMTKEQRLVAHPVSRILCAKSGATVGFVYEWNNGDLQPAWIGKRIRDVRYEPVVRDEAGNARAAQMARRGERSRA